MENTTIGVFGLTLVFARRNGDLAARSGRGTARREQTCRAITPCTVVLACMGAPLPSKDPLLNSSADNLIQRDLR